MGGIHDLLQWFAGGSQHPYMPLTHCLQNDYFWLTLTVVLDGAVAAGYGLIAYHWWRNQRHLPAKAPARLALGNMRDIFVFCGICGYAFIPIKMIWPAWRLYDLFLIVLVYLTWKYAWSAKDLKVVYRELGRSQKLEDDLLKSQEESRHKSLFLNALSHDLRTPLNGLILQANYAELSLKNGDAEVLSQALHEIKTCTRSTSDLLDALLEYARTDWSDAQNNVTMFLLDEMISAVVDRHRASAEAKKLTIRIGDSGGVQLSTDRVKLERILGNLLGNAVKFTQAGLIRVESQCIADARRNCAEIHVIDTGAGVEPAARDRLFEEFYQVHNHERDPRKGFGLGLSIAKRLATQLGGEIQVESAIGAGSRFSVVLPAVVGIGKPTDVKVAGEGLVAAAS